MKEAQVRDYSESAWKTEGLKTTPEGYLSGRLLVTGAGVFPYIGDGGKIVQRLRSIDEVGKSVESLANKPITLTHPGEFVNPDNAKKLTVGFCGNDVSWDGLNAFVTCTITDAHAIEMIRDGKVKALSAGYSCMIDDDEGTWQGVKYSQVQREIKYNHVALVYEGRAGDGVRFQINDSAEFLKFQKEEKNMQRKIQIDSVEYEADEAVINALKAAEKKAADASASLDKLTAEKDAAIALCTQKDAEIEKAKKERQDDASTFDARVKARVALLDVAAKAGMEKAEDKSDAEIRAFVIGKKFPNISLDGKSEDYVSALFDIAQQDEKPKNQADNSLDNDKGAPTEDGTDEAVAKAKAQYDEAFNNQGMEK